MPPHPLTRSTARHLRLIVLLSLLFLFPASLQARKAAPQAPPHISIGEASYYSDSLHGLKTANGERYDIHALTAAHRTMPLGTVVKVLNLRNGREIIVRINDRGPVSPRRIIDLSRAAATELNFLRGGVTNVLLETLTDRKGLCLPGLAFYLHLGGADSADQALRHLEALRSSHPQARSHLQNARLFVRTLPNPALMDLSLKEYFCAIGPITTYKEADALRRRLAPTLGKKQTLLCLKTHEVQHSQNDPVKP